VARSQRGFTLIEVLVVMTLLAVLMGLSVGFITRAQSGNRLLLATNSIAGQLASARAQSYGNDTSYVHVRTTEAGETTVKTFRDRQVFAWPAEDFEKASETGFLDRAGDVEISTDLGLEGHYAVFSPQGSISLGDPPWLDFLDGFSIECRLRPDGTGGSLFKKGDVLSVNVVQGGGGRLGIEAKIRLQHDEAGQGEGWYDVRTGVREAEIVPEWSAPLLPGRWHDVRIAYDRNVFTIHVDGRLRAVRSDRRNLLYMNNEGFVIGGGYAGGFDGLVVSGIFEDDQDRFDMAAEVLHITPAGETAVGDLLIHFRNRSLDPQYHSAPVRIWLQLNEGPNRQGAKRIVEVALSGETFVRRTEDLK